MKQVKLSKNPLHLFIVVSWIEIDEVIFWLMTEKILYKNNRRIFFNQIFYSTRINGWNFCKEITHYQPISPDLLISLTFVVERGKKSFCNLHNYVFLSIRSHNFLPSLKFIAADFSSSIKRNLIQRRLKVTQADMNLDFWYRNQHFLMTI